MSNDYTAHSKANPIIKYMKKQKRERSKKRMFTVKVDVLKQCKKQFALKQLDDEYRRNVNMFKSTTSSGVLFPTAGRKKIRRPASGRIHSRKKSKSKGRFDEEKENK